MLTKVALSEPLTANQLLEFPGQTYVRIKSMERRGFLKVYQTFGNRNLDPDELSGRRVYYLNRDNGFEVELRELLQAIAMCAGLSVHPKRPMPATNSPASDEHSVDLERIFGSTSRTAAIVVVALNNYLDATTIARVTGVSPTGNSIALLSPLLKGFIFKRIPCGTMFLYSLSDMPWSESLRKLCIRIAEIEPRFLALASAAKVLRDAEDNPHRIHLRNFRGRLF